MPGLRPDFSEDAMQRRVRDGVSGLPKGVVAPHERPGHRAPDPKPEPSTGELALDALRSGDGDFSSD